jgi:hypothetical protein
MKTNLLALTFVAASLVVSPALKAQIIWSTPTSGLGDASSVATNGSYYDALIAHIGASPETVVNPTTSVSTLFNAYEPNTLTDGTITFNNAAGYGGDGSNSSATPYDAALNGTTFVQNGIGQIQIAGLTTGSTYQIQIWNVDNDQTRLTSYTDGVNSVQFYYGNVIGTFTAGSSIETIDYTNVIPNGDTFTAGEVNAVDVRLVPEPATYAMLFAGIGALVLVARLRRAV